MQELYPELNDWERIESLSAMDAPGNMTLLQKLGALAATRDVKKPTSLSVRPSCRIKKLPTIRKKSYQEAMKTYGKSSKIPKKG